jgi:predicted DCC family thiol-disulfide oxidoreductase YuxK
MRQMYVVTTVGSRYGGAAAVRYLSRRLPRLWWLAPIMHFPGSLPFWQWGYRFVARQRYRFGKIEDCENGACSLHHR